MSIFAAELIGGIVGGSLALLADAGHLLADVGALGLALVAGWMASRPSQGRRTFGWQRAEILAALANGLVLVLIALATIIEAVRRSPGIGVRELADLYGLADALVLPSANEGFGLPMLEAGLRRLPIICTDIPALRETGRDDATYLPVDADGAAFARAIEDRLASDPVARLHRRARENEWPRILAELVLPAIHG